MKMEAQQLLVRTLPLIIAATLSGGFTGNAMAENSTEKYTYLDVGGAIRFNYGWLDYGSTDGIDLELLRADLKAGTGPLSFSAQYRWYDGFDAIHHAWLGWQFTPDTALKAGIQQVPFGLLPTASHSFWFGSGYYLGLEDDYDPGLVLSRQHGSTQWHLGWFSGDEYGDARRYRRYSFDIAATDALPYRERDRVHARIEHRGGDTGSQWLLGASGLVGRLQDIHSRQHHRQYAAAVHAQWQHGPWTTQLQWARYRHDVPGQRIQLQQVLVNLLLNACHRPVCLPGTVRGGRPCRCAHRQPGLRLRRGRQAGTTDLLQQPEHDPPAGQPAGPAQLVAERHRLQPAQGAHGHLCGLDCRQQHVVRRRAGHRHR